MYESKGLEFNDVGGPFLWICFISDKTKVLLYNFFADSTATLSQWRLVLNGVIEGDILSDAPTFDETRHASICIEVCHPRPKTLYPLPFTPLVPIVEILVRCNHSGTEKPLDHGQLRVSWANEGAGELCNLENSVHSLCRYTGAAGTRSKSGRLPPMFHGWRFRPHLKNGRKLAERQYCV